jgi:hypothetical protein
VEREVAALETRQQRLGVELEGPSRAEAAARACQITEEGPARLLLRYRAAAQAMFFKSYAAFQQAQAESAECEDTGPDPGLDPSEAESPGGEQPTAHAGAPNEAVSSGSETEVLEKSWACDVVPSPDPHASGAGDAEAPEEAPPATPDPPHPAPEAGEGPGRSRDLLAPNALAMRSLSLRMGSR